jgi:FKBP-type peptidyl-prolyl cis-trans isomerase (trigger factor)
VRKPVAAKADDNLAKMFGLDGIDKLRELMKVQVEQEHNGLTRTYMKRQLLDQLAAGHDFDVPPSMVEAEFEQIWAQLEQEAAREADAEAAKKEMEAEREEYRDIAVRRVRLGLLLSEIGQANGVEVTSQEMNMLVQQAAQQYRPEDRQRFVQYLQEKQRLKLSQMQSLPPRKRHLPKRQPQRTRHLPRTPSLLRRRPPLKRTQKLHQLKRHLPKRLRLRNNRCIMR